MLAILPEYEANQRAWSMLNVHAALKKLEPSCPERVARRVLTLLRKVHEVDEDEEMRLLQGLVVVLTRLGYKVTLHIVNAEAVRSIVLEAARLKHMAMQRKLREPDRQKFNANAAMKVMGNVREQVCCHPCVHYCLLTC